MYGLPLEMQRILGPQSRDKVFSDNATIAKTFWPIDIHAMSLELSGPPNSEQR